MHGVKANNTEVIRQIVNTLCVVSINNIVPSRAIKKCPITTSEWKENGTLLQISISPRQPALLTTGTQTFHTIDFLHFLL